MDPNSLLQKIEKESNTNIVAVLCSYLRTWLLDDGYSPCWLEYPIGRKKYYNWLRTQKK